MITTTETMDPLKAPEYSRKARLEKMIHRQYMPRQERAQRKNQYLIDNLSKRDDLDCFIDDPESLKQYISGKLESVEHTYRKQWPLFPSYDESSRNADRLSERQLFRVYLIMDALEDTDFIKSTGMIIEEDLADPCSEHGGLQMFNDAQKLSLHPVKSKLSEERATKNNGSYIIPPDSLDSPHIGRYHLHVTSSDSTRYAGPSGDAFLFPIGDIGNCHTRAKKYGESHNLVITKLKGRRFNIDYYGCEMRGTKIESVVLDLGNYAY